MCAIFKPLLLYNDTAELWLRNLNLTTESTTEIIMNHFMHGHRFWNELSFKYFIKKIRKLS